MSDILDRLKDPSEIKNLSQSEMTALAAELRGEIIDRVSQNGGHLASNLGVIELTIALFAKFNFRDEDQRLFAVLYYFFRCS